MNDPWIPSTITESDEFKESALKLAIKYADAFRMLPAGEKPTEKGAWACYPFDGVVQLWVDSSHPEALKLYDNTLTQKKERIMTKALTVDEQATVRELLANNIQAIKSVLPDHLTPERMLRMAWASISMNPEIGRCSQLSLMNAVIESSMIGLEIGGPLELAHLVPFKNNRTNMKEATLIIGYKGFVELMYRSPAVKSVSAHPVYSLDEFDYQYGSDHYVRHKPAKGDRGDLEYAYCIVFFKTGGKDIEVIDETIAMRHKARSPAKNKPDSPWNIKDQVHNMWVKTAIRIINKRVPKSPQLIRAIAADDMAEKGGQSFEHVIDVPFEALGTEAEPGPPKIEDKKTTKKTTTKKPAEQKPATTDPNQLIMNNLIASLDLFPKEVGAACKELEFSLEAVIKDKDAVAAQKINDKVQNIVDSKNQ